MNKTFQLYFKFVGVSLKSQMQHRASFFMLTTAYFLSTFVDIFGIWILFDRFKMIQGWTLEELSLLYGIMQMGFAVAEGTLRGFDTFSLLVRRGGFDRILLRPRGTLFQIAASEIQLMRMGRFLQAFLVLMWGFNRLGFSFISIETGIIIFAIIGTSCLFSGLIVLQATLSFWTTETLEIMNITTFGGMETGQYPMSIYKPPLRLFFTFIVPIACVGFYPMAALLHRGALPFWLGTAAPIFGVAFLLVSFQFWKFGVKHYHSTGN